MSLPQLSSPHSHRPLGTAQVMQTVILACIPGLLAISYFFGWGTLINILWLGLLALALEALVLRLRKRAIRVYLTDYSALVTAVLLGLSLPPTAPWWLGLIGIAFAIVIAKHLYGGLGYNPFNPAMVAYVVLLISFPLEMSTWLSPRGVASLSPQVPGFLDSLHAIFSFGDKASAIDAYIGATPLDEFKQQRGGMLVSEFWNQNPLFGRWSGRGWEWVNLGFLAGGLFLLYRKIISWHIPFSLLAVMLILSALFYDNGSSTSHGSPLLHLLGGATMLGAFFIATDPVSAATTPRGKLLYGALIGGLVYVIRIWGNYPDAMAFAVLLGNFSAPLIDYYTQPRTFGHQSGK
ncbi:MAG: electron transport complex subunit RsxD [Pseudomonadales bacterium]|nr:electron transport complex subunit RsxD [Pseudomonadales bacterium]